MTAVEILSDIIKDKIGAHRIKSITARHQPPHLILEYKLDLSGSWAKIVDSTGHISETLKDLGDVLKYRIFKADLKTGKIRFTVVSTNVITPSIPELQSGDYDFDNFIARVLVKYDYLPISYFDILPTELNVLILSKINMTNEVQSLCKAENICSDGIWRELFRLRFPQLFDAYIKLELSKYLDISSYLLYVEFQKFVETDLLTTYITQYDNSYSYPRDRFNEKHRFAANKVIVTIKYPKISDFINKDPILNNDESIH